MTHYDLEGSRYMYLFMGLLYANVAHMKRENEQEYWNYCIDSDTEPLLETWPESFVDY